MAASDRYDEFAATIATLRADHEQEIKGRDDRIFALTLENEMLKDLLKVARDERAAAVRTTVQLITQFATVEQVFATAKQLALQIDAYPEAQGIIGDQRIKSEPPDADHFGQDAGGERVTDQEIEALRNGHIPERFVATGSLDASKIVITDIADITPGAATERLRAMR